MTYLKKAKMLRESGFFLSGYGNFDISDDELALILDFLEKNDFKSIKSLYEQLEKERL